MAKKSADILESDLRNWKLLDRFRKKLLEVLERRNLLPQKEGQRKLLCDQYFSLILFCLFNPVVDTMRGVCKASSFQRVKDITGGDAVSLGSFSEAQHIFNPEVLKEVLSEVIKDRPAVFGDEAIKKYVAELTATDATLWRMMPRVHWAMFDYRGNQSIRAHFQFDVYRQLPTECEITPAATCERKVWKKKIKPGSFTVADRYYGHDYKLIDYVENVAKGSFALRLFNSAHYVEVGEPRPLSEADKKENVERDVDVRLGKNGDGPLVRLIKIRTQGNLFLIVTNRRDIPAELVSKIYRYRWQIELFFKWIKCILKCKHFLAESPSGVAIQVYCAMIAAVMLMAVTGKRPTKREMEALRFYQMGFATEEELLQNLKLA